MTHTAENDAPPHRLFHAIKDCGGCAGLGAHRRWCPYAVGETAAYFGQLSERADSLGDAIGPNDMVAANMAWQVAAILRKRAEEARVIPPVVSHVVADPQCELHQEFPTKPDTEARCPACRVIPPEVSDD